MKALIIIFMAVQLLGCSPSSLERQEVELLRANRELRIVIIEILESRVKKLENKIKELEK